MKIKDALIRARDKLSGIKVSIDDAANAAEAKILIDSCISALEKLEVGEKHDGEYED